MYWGRTTEPGHGYVACLQSNTDATLSVIGESTCNGSVGTYQILAEPVGHNSGT